MPAATSQSEAAPAPAPSGQAQPAATGRRNPLTPGERALVTGFVNRVLAAFGTESVARIAAFGSRARGGGHADSDLDVAVLLNPDTAVESIAASGHLLADLAQEAQLDWEALPPLRPVLLDPQHPQGVRERALLAAIDQEGIVLWPSPTT